YNVDLKNVVPSEDLTCLFAKDTLDESNLWHRRLGHINFKTMNKLVKEASNIRQEEPKRVDQALKDPSWTETMQEELLQFKMQKGHTQEECIDYEEVFAPVARIEAIRLFLAYASFMGFMVYQMDVKSDFLYGTIEEEVYVYQPLGFKDPDYSDKELCKAFEKLMKDKFQMSLMGELTFFLGLQVKQKDDGIFISQDKYVAEILRKFGLTDGKSASTPIDTEKPLLKDPDAEDVDTVVATSSTKAEYVAVASCCAQVLWIQNQLLDHSKELASPKQMALGKNESNPLIVDSLIKTIWLSIHHVIAMKHWLLQGKRKLASVSVKKTNDVVKLQALIERKKVVITEDTIRQALRLDDADGVECLPNEEISVELARMGYEKPPPKLTFYKAFFFAQWKFLIHMIVQCMSSKRTAWNEFSSFMASAVICLATVLINNQMDDISSHTTKYTSPALTQKVFANMRRIGKDFSRVETPLFDTMLVQPQADAENEDDDEVSATPTPPSPTPATTSASPIHKPSPPPQEPISSPPQTLAPPSSPPQEQPTQPTNNSESSMTLLITLMETYYQAQAEGQEVRKEEENKAFWFKEGRMEEDVTAAKEINAVEPEPTVFNNEEVTMTMAQTLIKMKAKKVRILDEQIAKRLHDEEVEQAAARERQEQDDFKRAQELQQQYDQKQENIDSNVVVEQMQEKHLDNIIMYQNLKRKPISVAQARKNMIVYLKNMAGYKIAHFKGMTYDQVRPIFERKYNKVQTFLKPDRDEEFAKKSSAEETSIQESFKKLRAEVEASGSHTTQEETLTVDPTEISEEDVQNMLQIVPVVEFKVESLQVKYPLIDWEIYLEGSRTYWKIIRVEKDSPLSNQVMTLMLSSRLQAEEDSEVARDLVMKIFLKANQPKSKSLDTSSKRSSPKINEKDHFELKGQFLKELHDNTFSGSDHEDANECIEKVLDIVDLFHIPNINQDQVMLRAFPMSLTGAVNRWLRNKPSGSITTWEDLKIKFLSKYCLPARTAKKMEINNFQQEPDETLYQAWERFKELLMKFPQHYLMKMQDLILFYNGLDVKTRQILDLKGAIPSKTAADAKIAIQEMAEYSQK
nr:hypothetical protein [Tanacetum cinerariifolium]